MNTTHSRKKLIAGAASAVAVAAALPGFLIGTGTEIPHGRGPPRGLPALTAGRHTEQFTQASGSDRPVAVLGPNGIRALPDGFYIAPVARAGPVRGVERASSMAPRRPRPRSDLAHAYRPAIVGSR